MSRIFSILFIIIQNCISNFAYRGTRRIGKKEQRRGYREREKKKRIVKETERRERERG